MGTAKTVWVFIQTVFAAIGGALGWYFGEINGLFDALLIFVIVEFVLGIVRRGLIEKKLSSKACKRQIVEKLLIFILVGVANIIDQQVIGDGHTIRSTIIFFYLSSEGIAIIEHAGHIGLPIPEKLRAILKELNEDETDMKDAPKADAEKKGGGKA